MNQRESESRDERECPYCAEPILSKARVCKHCGREVEPLTGTGNAAQTPPPVAAQKIPGIPTVKPLRAAPEPSGETKAVPSVLPAFLVFVALAAITALIGVPVWLGVSAWINRPSPSPPPEEQEKLTPEQGKPIEYNLFYAKAKSTGLPIGKRFRFTAMLTHDLMLYGQGGPGDNSLAGEAAFDDEEQHERLLQNPDYQTHRVVASMGGDGQIQIHRIE